MEFPFTRRIEVGWLFMAETTYAYYLVLRLGKGLPRLLALLPLLPLSFLVVWRSPTAFERTIYCSFFLWMLMFKFVLLAWDKGLAADPRAVSSFPQFLYACQSCVRLELDPRFSNQTHEAADDRCLVKGSDTRRGNSNSAFGSSNCTKEKSEVGDGGKKKSQSGGIAVDEVELKAEIRAETAAKCSGWMQTLATSQELSVVMLRSVVYYIVTASLLRVILICKDAVSEFVLDLLLALFTYLWCSLFLEVIVVIPSCVVGTELQPMFNMPFFADSLGDFWGRRWNLLVINLLRVSVFEPMLVILSSGKKKPSRLDLATSVGATFLVSGFMHELALFCASRTRPSWEMTTFFVLNGAATILERFLKARQSIPLPTYLRQTYTLAFVSFTAYCFFFPPLIRNGLLDGMASLRDSFDGIERMVWLQ